MNAAELHTFKGTMVDNVPKLGDDGVEREEEDDESGFAPPLGAPVLSSACAYSPEELLERMRAMVEPASAEEYLARVRLESAVLPGVVRVAPPPPLPPAKRRSLEWSAPQPVAKPRSSAFEFSASDRDMVLEVASRARDALAGWETRMQSNAALAQSLTPAGFPQRQERLQWMEFMFGGSAEQPGTPPLLHVVLQMDHVVTVRVLRCLVRACELDGVLDERRAAWIFALLVRLDGDAVTVEVAAVLSSAHRVACQHRALIADAGDELLAAVNVLIVLLEDWFGQGGDDDDSVP